ncbi:hypothetical protein SAMN02745857_00080 [Andreprevotia lacus DSM 23236]|jgi:hypothetical protein|uniref:Uncharacterized protein n=1 Tax=Andreprevotia lacus DSM 23236 TaxID=1121001 RepID=A0A1W1WWP7_9NEIS|nr:hypothetical protein [Andreprevotia lacus]SMC16033.1 hypothetical protein SAMN02745857_00080 [Andreprevotia lacus DSM 23236]
MAFYLRADQVPELQGLTSWERRVLLRGTFLKERSISTVFLLVAAFGSIQFVINPLVRHLAPQLATNQIGYGIVLLAWVLILVTLRDIVMMNVLRPKIAAKRAAQTAAKVAGLEQAQDQPAQPDA